MTRLFSSVPGPVRSRDDAGEVPARGTSPAPTPGPCWTIRHGDVIIVQARHHTYAIDTEGENRWYYSELEHPTERHLVTWPGILAWLNSEALIVHQGMSATRPFTVVVAR